MVIDLRRNELQTKIDRLEKRIALTKQQMEQIQKELDQVSERIIKRESVLRARVKAMYEQGSTTYLDVLLGSESFGEFLLRLQAIQMIIDQDQRILEDHQKDKAQLQQKEEKIKASLLVIESLMEESENLKIALDQQYKKSMLVKAALKEQQEQLSDIREEEEQALLQLIAAESKKIAETRLKSKNVHTSTYTGGQLFLPLPPSSYRLTSSFGERKDPFTGKSSGHNGLDMAAPKGTDIYAAEDGVVTVASYLRGYGNVIAIKHNEEITTLYAHIREGGIMVKVGQTVKRGEKIAEVGSTGRSTGNHLHFTVYKNGQPVNPSEYLR
ncbi:M23 family metallopeptidase [Brevibacillus agri]|nr:M23 family metallopeptidase [Brevibacillus agri]